MLKACATTVTWLTLLLCGVGQTDEDVDDTDTNQVPIPPHSQAPKSSPNWIDRRRCSNLFLNKQTSFSFLHTPLSTLPVCIHLFLCAGQRTSWRSWFSVHQADPRDCSQVVSFLAFLLSYLIELALLLFQFNQDLKVEPFNTSSGY